MILKGDTVMEFANDLMKKIGFDKNEQAFFAGCSMKYDDNQTYKKLLQMYNDDVWINLKYVKEELAKIAVETGDNLFTLNAVFLLDACEIMFPKFLAVGHSEELFYETMRDIKVKLDECKQVRGIYGVFASLDWFAGFYEITRFWLGRLQFEKTKFKFDSYEKDGVSLKKGDDVINVHIPSSGPMTMDELLESYDLACDHYKEIYDEYGFLPFVCHSWLLFEENDKILKPESNILKFKNQYDVIDIDYSETFKDGWRIFGSSYDESAPDRLPESTSLLRAYKKLLCEGKKTGNGYGIRIHKKGDR